MHVLCHSQKDNGYCTYFFENIRNIFYTLNLLILWKFLLFQDLNLHEHLTISQTYKFYGGMLNMNKDEIAKRTKELALLLELPSDNRLVETLR